MIAFDTNVLVRLLVEDDPEQFATAAAVLESAAEAGERCYLADAVLCEAEWVLTSVYGAGRDDILATFAALAADPRYVFDDPDALGEAVHAYEASGADFSGHLIGARARSRGARTTYTFDRKLRRREGFTHLR